MPKFRNTLRGIGGGLMKLNDVLDEIKDQQGIKTNRALANHIGIDERRVAEYYKGREPMDDDYPKIAIASGRRVDELQAIVKLSSGKDEKSRELWAKYYKSIGGLAASFMLSFFLVVTLIVTPTTAEASNRKATGPEYFVLCKVVEKIRKAILAVWNTLNIFVPRYGFSG
jgi:hypothetical protein